MNSLLDSIISEQNTTITENGAATFKSSLNFTLDFFALGGALRTRTDEDIISIFRKSFAEEPLTALKVLFYFRDCRGGQGERKTFRICLNWLAKEYPNIVIANLHNVVEFGRWDDLYCLHGTMLWNTHVLPLIRFTWTKELTSVKPSLFWKWLPSINTSNKNVVNLAIEIQKFLNISPKTYRKTLSAKRSELDVVERKMCASNWDKINYKSVPSKASLNYKDAFNRHNAVRYSKFIEDVKSGKTTINASTLYPYEIVEKCLDGDASQTLDVLWKSLPNYLSDGFSNGIVVADVSGSMRGRPLAASISLAMYISERNNGEFKNHFITFSEKPTLEKVAGKNIREQILNLSTANWGYNTNLESVFDLILNAAIRSSVPVEQMPTTIYIVSDMEYDVACVSSDTLFQSIEKKYLNAGYKRPKLVFWNVDARNTQTPVVFNTHGTCLVSGCSPSILKSLLSGNIETPLHVMYNAINVDRYNTVVI